MSGFGSIDDLLHNDPQSAPTKPSVQVSSTDAQAVFQKKMQKVKLKEKETETERFAAEIGVSYINLEKFPVSHQALRQVPQELARELNAICFFATQDEVRIGALDPTDAQVQELLFQVQERNHANGKMYTISEASLDHVLALYKTLPTVKPVNKDVLVKSEDLAAVQDVVNDFASFEKLLNEQETTDLVTLIMGAGLKMHASDVHIEAEEKGIVVRFRLDGMLHDAASLPKESYKKLISRLKLISSLKINVTDKPQDGRFTVKLPDGDVDVRVSTIPTVYGESIVMRLLVQGQEAYTLEGLGLRGRAFEQLKREIERPNGMIITTGPTGSGKTTTLYAIMHLLNQPNVKIITLEDPVEYKMEGINQSQIDRTHDYTFAKGLKSMLRQDPDIAMVGEIRELETAEIAIQAALTGHLILSTIHTNDAFGAIPRFLSMGVKPFLLAPSLNCVVGQRLVRKLCDCRQPIDLDVETKTRVENILGELPEPEKNEYTSKERMFYGPAGCVECNGIGYKGRVGIYEVFVIGPEIEKSILEGNVAEYDIRRIAREHGTITMVQDGILKALDGMTSVEEVFRVTE